MVICSTCQEEYIEKTSVRDLNLRDRIHIYCQHICQPENKKLKEENKKLRTCGRGNFTIFQFLQLQTNETALRRNYENYFIKKFKIKQFIERE